MITFQERVELETKAGFEALTKILMILHHVEIINRSKFGEFKVLLMYQSYIQQVLWRIQQYKNLHFPTFLRQLSHSGLSRCVILYSVVTICSDLSTDRRLNGQHHLVQHNFLLKREFIQVSCFPHSKKFSKFVTSGSVPNFSQIMVREQYTEFLRKKTFPKVSFSAQGKPSATLATIF